MWSSIVKPTLVLFIVCLVISGSLAYVNGVTKDTIQQNTLVQQEEFRKQVLTEADKFEACSQKGLPEAAKSVYAGMKGDQVAGYVVDVAVKGYGGIISMTVGVNAEGKITGVIIGSNNETPGLGSRTTEPGFISQFTGISLKDVLNNALKVVKQNKKEANEIQAVTGATISSRAVTKGVQAALDAVAVVQGGN